MEHVSVRSSPSRRWTFTLNNPEGLLDLRRSYMDASAIRALIYQEELSDSGTHHFQGYIECNRPVRFTTFAALGLAGAHFESARGDSASNVAYCSKEDTRIDGPYQYGVFDSGQGKRNDLLEVQAKLDDGATLKTISDEHFGTFLRYHRGLSEYTRLHTEPRSDKVSVELHWGPAGFGKSSKAGEDYPNAYWKQPNTRWFDSYDHEREVIFDDFNEPWFPIDTWKFMFDSVPNKKRLMETKGGSIYSNATTYVFTTNRDPRSWYKVEDWPSVCRRITKWFYWHAYLTYIEADSFESLQRMRTELGV